MFMFGLRHYVAALWLLATLFAAPAAFADAKGVEGDLAIETSDFAQWSTYRSIKTLNPESSPNGAYGEVNWSWDENGHKGKWYIEGQRYAADLVSGGIARRDTAAIDRGLLVLRWGFKQQKPDGGFDCPDAFHSTSFFVEAAAHSLLLLSHSSYAERYAGDINQMKPQLLAAAKWMTLPEIEKKGKKHNEPFTHRRYLVAAALGETGVLLDDPELVQHSINYIHEGIAMQDATGFNPERGGYDSSYHATGMWFALRYYTIVADDKMRPALYAMLEKAARWEASRVTPDGMVSTEGNSRVGGAGMEAGRSGKEKKIDTGHVYRVFYYWSVVSGDPNYQALAQKVAEAAHQWHQPK